jgi:hypothetical protein
MPTRARHRLACNNKIADEQPLRFDADQCRREATLAKKSHSIARGDQQ